MGKRLSAEERQRREQEKLKKALVKAEEAAKKKAEEEAEKKRALDAFILKFPKLAVLVDELGDALVEGGGRCKHCDAHLKIYSRSILWSSSLFVAAHVAVCERLGVFPYITNVDLKDPLMQRLSGKAQRTAIGGGAYLEGVFWGLLVPRRIDLAEEELAKRRHRLTLKGLRFVQGKITIPKYVWVFRGVPIRRYGPQISFNEACKTRFSFYRSVLGRDFPEFKGKPFIPQSEADKKVDWDNQHRLWSESLAELVLHLKGQMEDDPDSFVDSSELSDQDGEDE